MVTATTCEKCWNERQSLGGIVFHNIKTGEIWTLEVNICGTCRREITNAVSFLRFHGANVVEGDEPEPEQSEESKPAQTSEPLKETSESDLTDYEKPDSKAPRTPKAKP